MPGYIKKWFPDKEYGFIDIVQDDEIIMQLFFGKYDVKNAGLDEIKVGAYVEVYGIRTENKGLHAKNIIIYK